LKALIVEDDFTSRIVLQNLLEPYGESHIAVNGKEAISAFKLATAQGKPYETILLDIKMTEMDGHAVLKEIRSMEEEAGIHGHDGVKIIMTSALSDKKNILQAFKSQCEAYIVKPVSQEKLDKHLEEFGLI